MNTFSRKIELTANILIVVVGLIIVVVWTQKYVIPHFRHSTSAELPKAGDKVQLANVNWSAGKANVLLVLQKGCHYCTESASFYRQLIDSVHDKNVQILAVLPQARDEAEAYLNSLNINGVEIRQSRPDSLLVAGTPTIIVTDNKGEITNVWLGKLSPEQEKEVLTRLNE